MMVTFCLLAYQNSKQKIGKWELPTENSTPSDSVKAYRAYRIAKATNELLSLCIEEIGKLDSHSTPIEREPQIVEAKAKLDRLISWFEKYWSVCVTHAWQTGERKPLKIFQVF